MVRAMIENNDFPSALYHLAVVSGLDYKYLTDEVNKVINGGKSELNIKYENKVVAVKTNIGMVKGEL